tara:strand:- start:1550 stop:2203 length:654 start_codon:yes stop_codon:yes gene_type:complete
MHSNIIPLGQYVMHTQVPVEIFNNINSIYETKFKDLRPANKQLVGKIKNEHSLYYSGVNSDKQTSHNFLSQYVLDWFLSVYAEYLSIKRIIPMEMKISSIWVNEMTDNEYNPVHIHQGSIFTGLSSVMILKLPSHYGEEYSAGDQPCNGKLQIIGNSNGQFASTDYQPELKIGDFYIFPYDMRHTVFPFNSTNQVRRTLAANCDIRYDQVKYRAAGK